MKKEQQQLTDEEVQKIEEEERIRAEVRAKAEKGIEKGTTIIGGTELTQGESKAYAIIVLAILGLVGFAIWKPIGIILWVIAGLTVVACYLPKKN